MNIFPIFYTGSISYWSSLLNHKNNIVFDVCENYIKQTQRNRTIIYGANGKLALSIPIKKGNVSRNLKDIKISNSENWQNIHWKSLTTAYRTSPYFEYYEHDFAPFFEKKTDYLVDFNVSILTKIAELLNEEIPINKTEKYYPTNDVNNDFRNNFNIKKEPNKELFPEYIQVFSDKFGFIPDLSILDLLFNEGPNAGIYLKNL